MDIKQKENPKQNELEDYLNVASTMDCTGLIPSAPVSDEQLESYRALHKNGMNIKSDKDS